MSERCKVLIADDNRRTRQELRALLALRPEIEIAERALAAQEEAR